MIAIESGRIIGEAIATGWWEKDFERRQNVIEDLLASGMEQRYRDGDWTVGVELEARSRLILARYGIVPMHEARGKNTLVNGGTALLLDLLAGAGGTAYTNAVAALGVGDSNAAVALTQTNLQGAVNVTDRVRKAMAATFPSRVGNVLTFQSVFATTDANFTWNEWAAFNNTTDGSGTMLNRGVTNLGTKTSAAAWTLSATLTAN